MRPTLDVHAMIPLAPARARLRRRRPLGNKLQEIASRSPQDLIDLERFVDLILDELDEEQQQREA